MKFKQILLFGICIVYLIGGTAFAQTKSKTVFDPNSSLPETLEWLSKQIPSVYFLTERREGAPTRLEKRYSVEAKNCTLSFEIVSQRLDKTSTAPGQNIDSQRFDDVSFGLGEEWIIDLSNLNSQSITFLEEGHWTPAQVRFSVLAPGAKAIRVTDRSRERRGGTIYFNVNHLVVENKTKGDEIAKALKRGVELCQQSKH